MINGSRDVHQAMTVVVVLDADGRVILEMMVTTKRRRLFGWCGEV
jgi:hypothetical protein